MYWRWNNGSTIDEGGYGVFREIRHWATCVREVGNFCHQDEPLDVLDTVLFLRTLQKMGWRDARFVLLF